MDSTCSVYVFGDQTGYVSLHLADILRSGHLPILGSFFDQAFFQLRRHIGSLPRDTRATYPQATALADVVLWGREEVCQRPALQAALTCISNFGEFIRYIEGEGKPYPDRASTATCGLCTGALCASAISSCGSLSELVPVAVQVIGIAFQSGLLTDSYRRAISNARKSWSMAFAASSAAEALKVQIQSGSKHSAVSKPYLSADFIDTFTVSGPPDALEALTTASEPLSARPLTVPIYAPYHAPHIYSRGDIDRLLVGLHRGEKQNAHVSMISSATGSIAEQGDLYTRLEDALKQMLLQPLELHALSRGIAQFIKSRGATEASLVPVGTNHLSALSLAVQSCMSAPLVKVQPMARQKMTDTAGLPPLFLGHRSRSKIAIIGMSGRYPTAEDNEELWNVLLQGLDVHREAPALHWDVNTHVDKSGVRKNTSATGFGCWLDHPDLFDAPFFNMSPREAPQVDPAQRIALMTAYEAIEQAGIVPDATPSTRKDRVGVFYGVTSNDWMETNSAQNIDTHFIPGGNRAFIPGRVNYFFKFSGPSYSIDTACSSSLAAIHLACNSLWKGDVDTAIAGGTNVLTNPDFTAGLDRGHFLSRTGNCKTFDDDADGYCRGEGVGTVILKRLEDAIADNDPIQACIVGAYTNHSAEAESITRPHVGAQKAIFQRILNDAAIDAKTVSYVEMHGTGTQAGDVGEMNSVLETFAPTTNFRGEHELYVGSVKANVGHGEAASGVTALAKVLLMMRNKTIPPHCGIKTIINHKLPSDLLDRNVHIARKAQPWDETSSHPRRAFINNFSAAGGNSALLLEDYIAHATTDASSADPRTWHLVAVTAKHASSLSRNIKSLLAWLGEHEAHVNLGQLSYTTTARRTHYPHRVMVTGDTMNEIKSKLRLALTDEQGSMRIMRAPKVVFAFSGQGAQHLGMVKQLYTTSELFQATIRQLDRLGQAFGFPSTVPYFAGEPCITEHDPVLTQLATVAMQIAMTRLYRTWNIQPDAVIGHSLGEYAALNAAGVLTDADTIYLVGRRAQLLEAHCEPGTHGMLAIRASLAAVQSALAGLEFEVCCVNSPTETVVGSTKVEIVALKERLDRHSLAATAISVPYAFHTTQVDSILDQLETEAQRVTFHKATVPIISCVHGDVVPIDQDIDATYLRLHCRQTVQFDDALTRAKARSVLPTGSVIVEVGPHSVLTRLARVCLGSTVTALPSLERGQDNWHTITHVLRHLYAAGKDISWAEYHRGFKSSHRVLQIPAYSWNLKSYWIQYVNDWSLRKGDPPLVSTSHAITLQSSTVHTVLDESAERITVESDLCHPDLHSVTQGHVVDGIPLCTPSVYADIALTIGRYLVQRYHPGLAGCQLDVAEMTIKKALITSPEGYQPLQTSVEMDVTKRAATCRFATMDAKSKPSLVHATAVIRFTDDTLRKSLQQSGANMRQRMANLRSSVAAGDSHRYNRVMVYKMIRPLAQFHQDYKTLEEVILNSNTLEAASQIILKDICMDGRYFLHPGIIDGLTQSGGFVMNCNDNNDLDIEVFVNHGWKSFQLFQDIDPKKTYTSYVQMSKGAEGMYHGDLIVFDGEEVAASYAGICLQGVPRNVLRRILQFEAKQQGKNVKPAKGGVPPGSSNLSAAPKSTMVVPVVDKAVSATVRPPNPVEKPLDLTPAERAPCKPEGLSEPTPTAWTAVVEIIAEESGIAMDDVSDDAAWTDIGIDSLLSLTIMSRLREELDVDMDAQDLMTDYTTVGELKHFFSSETPSSREEFRVDDFDEKLMPIVQALAVPSDEALVVPLTAFVERADIILPETTSPMVEEALAIISDVTGLDNVDLVDDMALADLGIDSLMSLVICSRLNEELDVQLDQDDFLQFGTLGDLKTVLIGTPQLPDSGQSTGSTDSSSTSQSTVDEGMGAAAIIGVPPATSVILQGSLKTATLVLFLFPDGAGSATSYSSLPAIGPNIAVIGLNSPYYRNPAAFKCTLDDLVASYLCEIRQRQPTGPYHFAGWSAGGILAYHATYRAAMSGLDVQRLILIDTPAPRGLDHLPHHFYEFLSRHHLFGHATNAGPAAPPPAWLFPHFNATVDTLHDYFAEPLPAGKVPYSSLILAGRGVLEELDEKLPSHPDDTEGMKFLTQRHRNWKGEDWADLFPGVVLKTWVVDAHHFAMMRPPYAAQVSRFIHAALVGGLD